MTAGGPGVPRLLPRRLAPVKVSSWNKNGAFPISRFPGYKPTGQISPSIHRREFLYHLLAKRCALERRTVPVRSPGGYSNAAGQALLAFGGFATSLYGLFANDDGSGLHWERFSDIGGGQITALAPTYNGQSVFVGTDVGNILRLDAPVTRWLQLNVNLPAGSTGKRSLTGLVSFYSTLAYATMSIGGEGYVMSLDGNNWDWNPVASNLPHDRPLNSIVASDLRSIFVSTSAYVYDTHDGGKTWTQASSGLPADITGKNELKIVRESDRVAYLYLATYGRSLWRAQLPNARDSSGGGSGGVGPLPVPSR